MPRPSSCVGLVRVVAEQGDARLPQRAQHLRGDGVVARVGRAARARGWPRRCPGRRPGAGRRRAWRRARCRGPPGAGRAGSRRRRRSAPPTRAAAVRSRSAGCRSTSPVRHSLCSRTRGGSSSGETTGRTRSPSPRARCSRPSTSPSKVNTRASAAYAVGELQRDDELGADRGRRWSVVMRSPRQVQAEPGRQRVAQQHDVADRAHLGERGPAAGVEREAAVADEPAGPRVADEERRDDQLQLVGQVGGEELGVHGAAALDHQPAYAARAQVLAHPAHVDRPAAVDDGGRPRRAVARATATASLAQ